MGRCAVPFAGIASCLRTMTQEKCSPEIMTVISENTRATYLAQ
jgi:hypothetical protein